MTKWQIGNGSIILIGFCMKLMLAQTVFAADLELGTPSYGGTGCPQGSASVAISLDRKALSVMFDRFITEAGGNTGRDSDKRNCDLAVPIQVPAGYTVAIFSADYRGFVDLPVGASGQFSTDYFFAGQPGAAYTRNFSGTISQDFTFHTQTEGKIWSACGEDVILRSRSSMKVTSNARRDHVTGGIDSVDLTTGILYQFEMRPCESVPAPPPQAGEFRYSSRKDLSHAIGYADADGWAVNTRDQGAGHMVYGPYATNWGSGAMQATYRLMVDNNSADDTALLWLDINDATTSEVIAIKFITRRQFKNTFSYQDFSIDFDLTGREGHAMEARVYTFGHSYIRVGNLTVRGKNRTAPAPTGLRLRYEAERDLSHQFGYPEGDGWAVNTRDQGAGYMVYGPYARVWGSGPRRALFRMMLDNTSADNNQVMTIDIHDATAGEVIASRDVYRTDFAAPFDYQDFLLDFDLTDREGHAMEARIYTKGYSYIRVDAITIEE